MSKTEFSYTELYKAITEKRKIKQLLINQLQAVSTRGSLSTTYKQGWAVLINIVPRFFLEKYCGITTYLLLEDLICKLVSITCCEVHKTF